MTRHASTRARAVRDRIEERIVTGEYPPGMRLDETELAATYAVSRTPLREALIQLASTGLVDMRPGRATAVASVTPQRLIEMFEVMGEMEALCGRLAARCMSSAEHVLLQSAHDACARAASRRDPDAYYEQNQRFHEVVYEGSHNAFLAEHVGAMHRRLRTYRRLQLRVPHRIDKSLEEHERVVRAIIAGDEDTAGRELRAHVVIQGRRFNDLIASLQELAPPSANDR